MVAVAHRHEVALRAPFYAPRQPLAIHRFLDEGDKVKVTMRFRGRELAHQELGLQLLDRVKIDLGETCKVEQMPRMEGRQMVMVVAPKTT